MRMLLAALAVGVCGGAAAQDAVAITGPARAIDGDTLAMGPFNIRLHGVDAPERRQRCATADGGAWDCGAAAADRLAALVAGRDVVCRSAEIDDYDRPIATCEAGGVDLGDALVAEGLAWAFVRYSADYAPREAEARKLGLGVWQADTAAPWAFRAAAWTAASDEAPAGCPIKGNINREGIRIYHTPWSPAYARTAIRADKGERWFCDEAEALAAGWRPAGGARR